MTTNNKKINAGLDTIEYRYYKKDGENMTIKINGVPVIKLNEDMHGENRRYHFEAINCMRHTQQFKSVMYRIKHERQYYYYHSRSIALDALREICNEEGYQFAHRTRRAS